MTTPISKTKYTSQYIDNMSFDDELKVSVVEVIGADGVLKNPATEETLQALVAASGSAYRYVQKDEGATYTYFGFATDTGWKIMRKELSTSIFNQAVGTGTYATAWTNRASQSYSV